MKRLQLFVFLLIVLKSMSASAQQQPVEWKYDVVRVNEKEVEICIEATIREGWHIYAMEQGENFIGKATSIRLKAHPLIKLIGGFKEIGNVVNARDASMGIETRELRERVQFVQRIQVKTSSKTSLSGQIEFQSCTGETCLSPAKIDFTIVLNDR